MVLVKGLLQRVQLVRRRRDAFNGQEVVTVGAAIQYALAEHPPGGVYVIGAPAIFRHVSEAGHRIVNGTGEEREAGVVVVAANEEFSYGDLRVATQAVLAGAEILAAGQEEANR